MFYEIVSRIFGITLVILCAQSEILENNCNFPGSPKNGYSLQTGETFSTIEYKCETGFELLGDRIKTCNVQNERQRWRPNRIPKCVRNVATNKPAVQSSTSASVFAATRALKLESAKNVTCSATYNQRNPYWYVDLFENFRITAVRLILGHAIASDATLEIRVSKSRHLPRAVEPICNHKHGPLSDKKQLIFTCNYEPVGRFVNISIIGHNNALLSLCNVEVLTEDGIACPNNTQLISYQNTCYSFQTLKKNFEHARAFCESIGGNLVENIDKDVHEFLKWILHTQYTEIHSIIVGAMRNAANNHEWVWLNGDSLRDDLWARNESQGETQYQCVRMDRKENWRLSRARCLERNSFVCQIPPTSCTIPQLPADIIYTPQLKSPTAINSNKSLSCASGFTPLQNPMLIECLPDAVVNTNNVACVRCEQPPMVLNATFNLVDTNRIRYKCLSDAVLTNGSDLTCSQNKWIGSVPFCVPRSLLLSRNKKSVLLPDPKHSTGIIVIAAISFIVVVVFLVVMAKFGVSIRKRRNIRRILRRNQSHRSSEQTIRLDTIHRQRYSPSWTNLNQQYLRYPRYTQYNWLMRDPEKNERFARIR